MAVTAVRLVYQWAETTRIARGAGCSRRMSAMPRCTGCGRARSWGCHGPRTRRAWDGRSSRLTVSCVVPSTGRLCTRTWRINPSGRSEVLLDDLAVLPTGHRTEAQFERLVRRFVHPAVLSGRVSKRIDGLFEPAAQCRLGRGTCLAGDHVAGIAHEQRRYPLDAEAPGDAPLPRNEAAGRRRVR